MINRTKATECPAEMFEDMKKVPNLLYIAFLEPNKETNELAAFLDDELGYYSKAYTAYLNSFPKVDPKTRKNVINEKSDRLIGGYVMLSTVNGNVNRFFFNSKIQPQVEAKIAEFEARKSQKKS